MEVSTIALVAASTTLRRTWLNVWLAQKHGGAWLHARCQQLQRRLEFDDIVDGDVLLRRQLGDPFKRHTIMTLGGVEVMVQCKDESMHKFVDVDGNGDGNLRLFAGDYNN